MLGPGHLQLVIPVRWTAYQMYLGDMIAPTSSPVGTIYYLIRMEGRAGWTVVARLCSMFPGLWIH